MEVIIKKIVYLNMIFFERQSQNLKFHTEMNATQSRDLNHLNHPFGSKSGRSSRRKVAHLQKQQETRDRDAKIKTKKDLNGENDFYIEENDEPKEKLYVVEIQDFGDGTKSGERGKDEDEPHTGNTETVQRFRRGPYRHLLQFQSEENIPTPGYIQGLSLKADSLCVLLLLLTTCERYRAFSLKWLAAVQIYCNKRNVLHKKRVQLPQDWFGTPSWPPFHSFGTKTWRK